MENGANNGGYSPPGDLPTEIFVCTECKVIMTDYFMEVISHTQSPSCRLHVKRVETLEKAQELINLCSDEKSRKVPGPGKK